MHQSDVGFINGNLLGVIKNAELSKEKLELNLEAIGRFIKGESVEGKYGEKDCGRDYVPEKYEQ